MLGDNQAMYTLITQEGATSRTRYYERATMLIKRAVLMLLLIPLLVSTKHMIADIFTKALDKGSFILFRDIIMNNNPRVPSGGTLDRSLGTTRQSRSTR